MTDENSVIGFDGTWDGVNFIFAPQGTQDTVKDCFKLWGITTKWEKTPLNWFLCIVCFGWIWMAF
jgi:hypothetical protein